MFLLISETTRLQSRAMILSSEIVRNGLEWIKGVKIIITADMIFKLRVNIQREISV